MPLGSLVQPPGAVLGRPWTPKTTKRHKFLKVFANAVFRYFEAFDGPLGPISAPLGPILGLIWPPRVAQQQSKNGPVRVSKMGPKIPKHMPLLGHFWDQNNNQKLSKFRIISGPRWHKTAKMLPDGPRWPQDGPRRAKMLPRCSQEGPELVQDAPKWSQDGTRMR
jgi:hypothetical protein